MKSIGNQLGSRQDVFFGFQRRGPPIGRQGFDRHSLVLGDDLFKSRDRYFWCSSSGDIQDLSCMVVAEYREGQMSSLVSFFI
ncbi:MAG: hypothetical protein OXE77_09590 [Flavobacteriaceae bacterium]|nr:hypothetical protein [Flavobacteriaceae bacterium]